MRVHIALLIASLAAAGCSTVVPRTTLPARSSALNIEAVRGPSSVSLIARPDPQSVTFLTLTADSLHWIDAMTENVHAVRHADIGSITIRDRATGLLVGYVVGGVAGYGVGSGVSGQSEIRPLSVALGMLVGGVVGYIVGVPHTYHVDHAR